jgi:hypothetical protein
MTSDEKAELLERHLALADAVARAVAYQSPSPVEEYRSGVNRDLIALREEIDGGPEPDTDPQPDADVPAAQEQVEVGEPVAAEPGIVEQAGDAPEEHKDVDVPTESAPAVAEDAPGAEQADSSVEAAQANPGAVDGRGDVGAGRPDHAQERGDLNAQSIRHADDNEV